MANSRSKTRVTGTGGAGAARGAGTAGTGSVNEAPAMTVVRHGERGLVVSAKAVHQALGVGRDFSNWLKGRISRYGFELGVDFWPLGDDESFDCWRRRQFDQVCRKTMSSLEVENPSVYAGFRLPLWSVKIGRYGQIDVGGNSAGHDCCVDAAGITATLGCASHGWGDSVARRLSMAVLQKIHLGEG